MAALQVCQSCPIGFPSCALIHSLNPNSRFSVRDNLMQCVSSTSFSSASVARKDKYHHRKDVTLTREVFQHAEADRLAIWWGGTLWIDKLSAQNSAAEPQYPPRYEPRKFLDDTT